MLLEEEGWRLWGRGLEIEEKRFSERIEVGLVESRL